MEDHAGDREVLILAGVPGQLEAWQSVQVLPFST